MYGRITRFKIKPELLAKVLELLPQVREKTSEIAGGVANYAMWNDDGSGLAVAIYESAEAAEAAAGQINAIWGGLAPMLAEPLVFELYSHAESMRN